MDLLKQKPVQHEIFFFLLLTSWQVSATIETSFVEVWSVILMDNAREIFYRIITI